MSLHNEQLPEQPREGGDSRSSAATFETLPIGILVQLLKYIPVAQWPGLERVSHHFRDGIYEAWRTTRRIRLDEDMLIRKSADSEATNLALEKLTLRAVNITNVGGFDMLHLDEASIDLIARFAKLERVEFSRVYISAGALDKFLKESASRENLKIFDAANSLKQEVPRNQQQLFEAFKEEAGLGPLKLETFDISRNGHLPVLFSFLNVIDVSRLTSFLSDYTHVNRSLFVNFLARATNLQKLAFSFDCYSDEQRWDRRAHAGKPQLSHLVLKLNKEIIQGVGNLEELVSLKATISGTTERCDCRNFEVEMATMLNELGRRGTLKELSLPDLATTAVMNSIAMSVPNLYSLEFGIDDCTEADAEYVLKAQGGSLVNLRIDNDDMIAYPTPLITHIVVNALHLQSLCLDYACYQGYLFSPAILPKGELLQIVALKQLKELSVYDEFQGNDIDNEVLAAWAEAFGSELESLSIPRCYKVTDESLLALVNKAPRLVELDISCADITDHCLSEMTTQCPKICKLDLSDCSAISAEGVQAVVDGCTRLKRLHIAGKSEWFPDKLKIGKYRKILLFSREIRSPL